MRVATRAARPCSSRSAWPSRSASPTTSSICRARCRLVGELVVGGAAAAVVARSRAASGRWLTVAFVVVLLNAVNLLDGLDGLAAGVAAVAGARVRVRARRRRVRGRARAGRRAGRVPRVEPPAGPDLPGRRGKLSRRHRARDSCSRARSDRASRLRLGAGSLLFVAVPVADTTVAIVRRAAGATGPCSSAIVGTSTTSSSIAAGAVGAGHARVHCRASWSWSPSASASCTSPRPSVDRRRVGGRRRRRRLRALDLRGSELERLTSARRVPARHARVPRRSCRRRAVRVHAGRPRRVVADVAPCGARRHLWSASRWCSAVSSRSSSQRSVPGSLVAALAGIGVVCAIPRARLGASLATAACVPFALLLTRSLEPGPRWLHVVVVGAASAGAVAVAATDRLWSAVAITPALLAITALAVYVAVPDTEEAAVLVGVALPLALLGWPLRWASLGAAGAGATTALVVWTVATGGRADPAAVGGRARDARAPGGPVGRPSPRRGPRAPRARDRSEVPARGRRCWSTPVWRWWRRGRVRRAGTCPGRSPSLVVVTVVSAAAGARAAAARTGLTTVLRARAAAGRPLVPYPPPTAQERRTRMFPFWEVAIAPVLDAAGARRVVEIGALRGETTVADARATSGPTPSCTSSTRCRSSTPPSTSGGSRAATSSTAALSLDVLPDARRRWTPRSSTATTTGTRSTTSCGCSAEAPATRGAPLPGADPPRRRLALRPARPLLRPRPRSPRSSASRTRQAGMRPGRAELLDRRRAQPDDVQRRARRAVRATA